MRRVVEQRGEERPERRVEGQRGQHAAEDAEEQRVDVEQAGDDHQRQEARHDEVLDRVDAEHLERVELLADLARAEVGGDRRAADAGEDDRGHERGELADRGEHEEAAEAVDRAEQDEEVARLEPRRAVAERDRRDRAAGTSTAAARTGTAARTPCRTGTAAAGPRHDRLAGQDHHVADLLEQVLRRQECSVGYCSNHSLLSPPSGDPRPPRRQGSLRHGPEHVPRGNRRRSSGSGARPVVCSARFGGEESARTVAPPSRLSRVLA